MEVLDSFPLMRDMLLPVLRSPEILYLSESLNFRSGRHRRSPIDVAIEEERIKARRLLPLENFDLA